MLYTEEQIQRANERNITEYFRQAGYSCKRVGSETHIEGFGGFYVNETTIPNKFYIHSQQKGGVGLVNCLMKVMDMPFKEAVRAALDGELGQEERPDSVPNFAPHIRKAEPFVPEPKPEFIMPEKGESNHRVFSYLTKTRHIDANVVNEFIRAGVLFQSSWYQRKELHSRKFTICRFFFGQKSDCNRALHS